MVMFALLIPVFIGFLALSLAASIELDTKASLDQAAITAAVAGSSDACMASQYAFEIYECKSRVVQGEYGAGAGGYGIETDNKQLPQPGFTTTGGWTPVNTKCLHPLAPLPRKPNCPATDTGNFIVD
jgi:hypothetical protein